MRGGGLFVLNVGRNVCTLAPSTSKQLQVHMPASSSSSLLKPDLVFSGQEVQAPGSETQEDQGNAPPAQQARGESAHKETAEERPPLFYAQICCQSLKSV